MYGRAVGLGMLRGSWPMVSLGSHWTQRWQLRFPTGSHLPGQSDYLSLSGPHLPVLLNCLLVKLGFERNVRTRCEVSLWARQCPHAERMKHRRWGNVLHPLSRKGTYNMPQDDKTKHSARSMLPSLPLPVQSPFEKTILSDCLSLPLSQDLSQVTCRSAGTCHMPESRNPRKPISWELLSLLHRHKPLHTDYRKCLSEDVPTGKSFSFTSNLTRYPVFGFQNMCRNLSAQTGFFRKDLFSRWAGYPLKAWFAIGSLTQARPLHQGPASVVLSAENEARCRQILLPNVAVYERERAKAQARGGQRGWAAVLVSLCSVGGEPALLFTLRSSKLKGRHKGDVSFAGGKQDPSDRDVVDTALREACEELGVSVAASSVWGTLKPLRDMSGMLVAPVLANLGPLEALSFCPSPNEVEEIFTITLAHLCDPKNRGYTNFRVGDRYGYTMPVFLNAKHRVWGLTAMALDHALKVIVPPGRGVQA